MNVAEKKGSAEPAVTFIVRDLTPKAVEGEKKPVSVLPKVIKVNGRIIYDGIKDGDKITVSSSEARIIGNRAYLERVVPPKKETAKMDKGKEMDESKKKIEDEHGKKSGGGDK